MLIHEKGLKNGQLHLSMVVLGSHDLAFDHLMEPKTTFC